MKTKNTPKSIKNNNNYSPNNKLKVFSTFSGVWWFEYGLTLWVWSHNIEIVGHSELEKNKQAIQTYNKNFPNTPYFWDITKIDIKNMPNFDLLVWGFPCTDVSSSWLRDLSKWRTILVKYLLKMLKIKKPKYFVFENVKGLLWKDFKDFFKDIINTIEGCWYNFDYKIFNNMDVGLPQSRRRVYIMGIRKDLKQKVNVVKPHIKPKSIYDIITIEWVADDYYLTEEECEGVIGCQNFKKRKSYSGKLIKRWDKYPIMPVIQKNHTKMWWNSWKIQDTKGIRILTEEECEIIQWFPIGWTEWVSQTKRYQQIGNSVCPPLVSHIIKSLLNQKKECPKCKNIMIKNGFDNKKWGQKYRCKDGCGYVLVDKIIEKSKVENNKNKEALILIDKLKVQLDELKSDVKVKDKKIRLLEVDLRKERRVVVRMEKEKLKFENSLERKRVSNKRIHNLQNLSNKNLELRWRILSIKFMGEVREKNEESYVIQWT